MVSVGLITTLIALLFLKAPVIIAMGASVAVDDTLRDQIKGQIAEPAADGD